MKKAILFSVIIFIGQLCFGQKGKVHDSILKKKIDSLVYVVADLWNTELDSAEIVAKHMLSYSNKHNYKRGIARSYGTLAGVYDNMGNAGKSLAYYIKAVNAFEVLGDEVYVNKLSNNIGLLLISQREYKEASYYINKAHDYFSGIEEYKNLPNIYLSLGTIDINTNASLDAIMINLKKAENFSIKKNDTLALCLSLNLQGEAYVNHKKNIPYAISRLEKAIDLMKIKDSNDHFNLGYSYLHLGRAYWTDGMYNKALLSNDLSLFHYKTYNSYQGLKTAYNSRKDIFYSLGNYKKSLEAFETFNRYKDSVFNKDKANQIARLKTEFETNQIIAQKQAAESKVKLTEVISKKNKIYFISTAVIAGLILLVSIFYFSRLKAKKKAELVTIELKETQKRLAIEKQYRDSELKALKAQMNPHFIFNALNSIQDYIVLNQKNLASDYLGKFADLIRNYLHFSDTGFISIQDEIHNLKLYLELEKLRFEEQLEYTIQVDDTANFDEINIPTMLVQPYVENALKHGLLHKKDNRKLHISISKTSDKIIECTIEDNGIGREKSKKINTKREGQHKSFALKATTERLDLLNYGRDKKIGVEFIDLKDNEKAVGTKVILVIPIIKK
ncbi:histidine kinase [Winogradskyella helgolandensis]|uniref:histidine kinase n=1 Tax=Winogradskyella helgolandensis TaxID=2697010 RepID=UPI0015BD6664|nr:histidine kinase [Winogradskyella helgolandensis]